jgi:hypothetical protein
MPPKKSEEQKAAEAAAKAAAKAAAAEAKAAAKAAAAEEKAAAKAVRNATKKAKSAARRKSQKRGSNSNTSEKENNNNGAGAPAAGAPARKSRAERAAAIAAAREARAAEAAPSEGKRKLLAFCLNPTEEDKLPGGRVILQCLRTTREYGSHNAEVAFQHYFNTPKEQFKLYHLCKGTKKAASFAARGYPDRSAYRCYTKGYENREDVEKIAKEGEFAKEEGSPESLKSSKAGDKNHSDSESESESESENERGDGPPVNPFGEDEESTPKPGPAGRTRSAGPATRLRSLGNGIGNLVKFKRGLTRKTFNTRSNKPDKRILSLSQLRRRARTPVRTAAPAPAHTTRKAKSRTPSPKKRGEEGVVLKAAELADRPVSKDFLATGSVAEKARAFQEEIERKAAAARAPVSSLKKGPSAP